MTSKGDAVYAILPRWPGKRFVVKDLASVKSASLLGTEGALKVRTRNGGAEITMPDVPEDLMRQPAWVLKLSR